MNNFYFKYNSKFEESLLLSIQEGVLKHELKSLKKLLKIKTKKNTSSLYPIKKCKDYFIELVTDKENQKKIVTLLLKKLDKIPKGIINYFLERKPENKEITKQQIKEFLIDYIRLKYNQESVLNIDISFILFQNYYGLDEEGPREYVFDQMKKYGDNESQCNIL